MEQDIVIRKVEKLLRMSQDESSLNEAMVALEMANKMITEHNIKQEQLNRPKSTIQESVVREGKRIPIFERNVWGQIGRVYQCQTLTKITHDPPSVGIVVVGREANVASVRVFAPYVYNAIQKELKKYYKYITGKRARSDFRIAALCTIAMRLQEKTEEAYHESNLPVPVDDVDKYLEGMPITGKAKKPPLPTDPIATKAGIQVGQNIGIEDQLDNDGRLLE